MSGDIISAGLALEMRRRTAYRLVFGAAAAALTGLDATPARAQAQPQFLHGVASGDPRGTRVIIWTRVTPPGTDTVPVTWTVAQNADMTGVVAAGDGAARASRDFTVKIDVDGLAPGGTYFYQFAAGGVLSPVGRTRTLPALRSTTPLNLAVFSCSNYEKGFFNVYGEAAKDDSIFAVLHLGDYTYEYGVGGFQTAALATGVVIEPRAAELTPTTETVLLDAYRTRLALYRTDPDLQALHAKCPWITIYDDHETANDGWTGGAENHTSGPKSEGSWRARKRAALQAYYEWLPIRDNPPLLDPATGNPAGLFRSFTFGKLARLIMLDSRLAGRDRQLDAGTLLGLYGSAAVTGNFNGDAVDGRPRSLLGAAQEAWLDERLSSSEQTWQIIGNQTLAHYQIAPDYLGSPLLNPEQKAAITEALVGIFGQEAALAFGFAGANGLPNPATADSWNGYPSARQRLNASLAKASNPIIVSGDSHNAWAANLAVPLGGGNRLPVGVEFGTASVTAPGFEETFVGFPPALIAALITQSSAARSPGDRLIYTDASRRGFIKLEVTEAKVAANFVFVSTAFETSYTTATTRFEVLPGTRKISGT